MTLGKLLLQTLVAAGDSATFGALFQVEKRHYLACAITGAAGWVTYCLAVEAGCSVAAASFPLVPGAGIYYTAYYFIFGFSGMMVQKGIETVKVAVAIALGITLVLSLPMGNRRSQ